MERPIANLRFYGVSSTIVSKPANANFLTLQTLTERLTHHLCSLEHYYERIDHTGKFENLISCSRYDGADDDWIVATLLHDIGDGLAPQNHDRMAAEILRPFVREEVTWVVEHHGAFQMIYYAHHLDGWNPNERDQYRDHAYYQTAVDFCERWDQNCFGPQDVAQRINAMLNPDGLFISVTPCLRQKMSLLVNLQIQLVRVLCKIGLISIPMRRITSSEVDDLLIANGFQVVASEEIYKGASSYFLVAKKLQAK